MHFDVDWDVGYRPITRPKMSDAAEVLEEVVNFGEVDWDREVELAKRFELSICQAFPRTYAGFVNIANIR